MSYLVRLLVLILLISTIGKKFGCNEADGIHQRSGTKSKLPESKSLTVKNHKKYISEVDLENSVRQLGNFATRNAQVMYPKIGFIYITCLTKMYKGNGKFCINYKKRRPPRRRRRKARRYEKHTSSPYHQRRFGQESIMDKEPSFDHYSPSTVKAQLGSNAFLKCKIHNLQDKSVSWIRNRDSHILTIDRYTFISDSRFVSWFDTETDTWILQVKFATPQDAGRYECQVSTEPKRSHFVTLSVVVPRVVISGQPELHVRRGSDVVFNCTISNLVHPPAYVFWYHSGSSGNLVHQAVLQEISEESSNATLIVRNVERRHTGNYTCAPIGITASASILLHVLTGEHHAAMQHGSSVAPTLSVISSSATLYFLLHIFLKFKMCLHS